MISPMNPSTSDLNPSERVLSKAVFTGGGFSTDVSGITKGAVLIVGGDVDLSVITFLHYSFYN